MATFGVSGMMRFRQARYPRGESTGNNGLRTVRGVKIMAMKWDSDRKNKKPRDENVEGSFFVDHSCIDCDTCRWMAPKVFGRVGDQSAIIHQPGTQEERVTALKALFSCPTFSIHARGKEEEEVQLAMAGMPIPVEGCPGVYNTGFADEKSIAGTAYFIARPGGNILVDSPRHDPRLVRRIKEMGGVKYMFLTHRDDVGDHAKWKEAFPGLQRIIHKKEVNSRQGTLDCEIQLEGEGPWRCGGPDADDDDVDLIHTPGHTEGHVCLLYKPAKVLFSGDHLERDLASPEQQLHISKDFNWFSVPVQLASVEKLLQYDFLTVLPAHGRRIHMADAAERTRLISGLLQREGFTQPAPVPQGLSNPVPV